MSSIPKPLGKNNDAFPILGRNKTEEDGEKPTVIVADDERIILTGGMPMIREVMPSVAVYGFGKPSEAIAFAQMSPVAPGERCLFVEFDSERNVTQCRAFCAGNSEYGASITLSY